MNNRQLVRNVMQKRAFQRGEHLHHLRNASFNQRQAGAREIFVNYIKNPLVKIKELPSRLIDEALEELFEITADELTEKVTEALREAQIDEHVSSFKEGFFARDKELVFSDGYEQPQTKKELEKEFHDEDYIAGYFYRQENPQRWSLRLQKKITEMGYAEWNDLVDEGYVKTKLIEILKNLNPIKLAKHMIHTIKKHGFAVALPIVISEVLLHTLPLWASKIMGPTASLAVSQIPITEILTPAYLKYVASADKAEPVEYLDWYEHNYGEIEDVVDEDGNLIPLSPREI
jgi:hypothetical protein